MNLYFYIDNEGKQKGTYSPESLKNEHIKRETLVWTQGMSQWSRADEVAELQFLFSDPKIDQTPPPPFIQHQSVAESQNASTYSRESCAARETSHINTSEATPLKPKNWLVESILVTIIPFMFCCNVFSLIGIVAIVNASKVDHLFFNKEYEASKAASKTAKTWVMITLGIVLVFLIFFIILFATGVYSSFVEKYIESVSSFSGDAGNY